MSVKDLFKRSTLLFDSGDYGLVTACTIPRCFNKFWKWCPTYSPLPLNSRHFIIFRSQHFKISDFRWNKFSISLIISITGSVVSLLLLMNVTNENPLCSSSFVTKSRDLPNDSTSMCPTTVVYILSTACVVSFLNIPFGFFLVCIRTDLHMSKCWQSLMLFWPPHHWFLWCEEATLPWFLYHNDQAFRANVHTPCLWQHSQLSYKVNCCFVEPIAVLNASHLNIVRPSMN